MTTPTEKRAAKVRKRHDRKEADMSRIDAREARLRLALQDAGGEQGEAMTTLVRFFLGYSKHPRPDLVMDAIDWIHALNLMALPEHRYGIAGSIRGVMDLVPAVVVPDGDDIELSTPNGPPPEAPDIQAWRRKYPKIIESVERLVPPEHDVALNRSGHVDYLGMRWMVARNPVYLDRVIRLINHPNDEVSDAADIFLQVYQGMPEVQTARLIAAGITITAPEQVTQTTEQVTAHIAELVEYLTATPSEREHTIYVGWVPGQQWVNQGTWTEAGFVIATMDGQPPKHCPVTWHDQPVTVRRATPAELEANRALALERDKP